MVVDNKIVFRLTEEEIDHLEETKIMLEYIVEEFEGAYRSFRDNKHNSYSLDDLEVVCNFLEGLKNGTPFEPYV